MKRGEDRLGKESVQLQVKRFAQRVLIQWRRLLPPTRGEAQRSRNIRRADWQRFVISTPAIRTCRASFRRSLRQ